MWQGREGHTLVTFIAKSKGSSQELVLNQILLFEIYNFQGGGENRRIHGNTVFI